MLGIFILFLAICAMYAGYLFGEQDVLVVKTPACGSEGPRFDPGSTILGSCHGGGLNSHTQAYEVYSRYCLPPRL